MTRCDWFFPVRYLVCVYVVRWLFISPILTGSLQLLFTPLFSRRLALLSFSVIIDIISEVCIIIISP